MQFSTTVSDFMQRLSPLSQIVSRRATIPATENFLFSMGEGEPALHAWATNLDSTMETHCPVTPQMMPVPEKRFLLPARRLMEILRTLPPAASLQVTVDENGQTHLKCDKTRFRLFSPSADTFPSLPSRAASAMHIRAGHLAEAIRQASYAIGEEEARYQLSGGQFVVEFPADAGEGMGDDDEITGGFVLAATDGHRLALSRQTETLRVTAKVWRQWQGGERPPASVVIPRRTLLDLLSLLEAHSREDVDFSFTPDWNFFRIGNYHITSRNLAGIFPRYETITATVLSNEVVMDTAEVLATVRRVSVLTDEITFAVRLSLSSGLLTVQSSSPQMGEALDSVPVDYAGSDITIGINATYFIDTLRAIPTRKFRFCFENPRTQIGVLPHPGEDEALTTISRHIIMPLHL